MSRKGFQFENYSYVTIDPAIHFDLNQHLSEEAVKELVLTTLGVREGDQIALLSEEGKIYYYDPSRPWKLTTMEQNGKRRYYTTRSPGPKYNTRI